jgi:hypothetical protein
MGINLPDCSTDYLPAANQTYSKEGNESGRERACGQSRRASTAQQSNKIAQAQTGLFEKPGLGNFAAFLRPKRSGNFGSRNGSDGSRDPKFPDLFGRPLTRVVPVRPLVPRLPIPAAISAKESIMSSKQPSHIAYIVIPPKDGSEAKSIWRRVGSVFPHGKGNGFDVVIPEGISVTGRIVCTVPKDKDAPEEASVE